MKQIAKDKSLRGFLQRITGIGAREAKIIDPKTVETAPWVRWKCQYGCGGYNSSLMCPPHAPTPGETRMVLDSYKRAILFEAGRLDTKKIAVKMEREAFLSGYYKAFGQGGTLVQTQIIIENFRAPFLYSAHNSSPFGNRGHSEIALLTRLQNGMHVVDEDPPFPLFKIWPYRRICPKTDPFFLKVWLDHFPLKMYIRSNNP